MRESEAAGFRLYTTDPASWRGRSVRRHRTFVAAHSAKGN
jgi:hypothetical protein